jgi:ubiquinone/menaquinone biosynthesis C-methylase UbiE
MTHAVTHPAHPANRTTTYTAADALAAHGYLHVHDGWGAQARYLHSRIHAVAQQVLLPPRGELLDIGCGPGVMLRHLADTRPGDFALTGLDQSHAMVELARRRLADVAGVELVHGDAGAMPFPDASFDVVLAMGVLEYTHLPHVLDEISRVTRPGGLVVVTMLNPLSLYRLVEWGVFWPGLRLLGRLERLVGVPTGKRHRCPPSGIRVRTAGRLQQDLERVGLRRCDLVYYDLTPTAPPLDRVARRVNRRWRDHPETTIGRGLTGVLGTAYLIAARKPG